MTLGNRILVMNAGRAEQIGTPQQIYQQPASTFVAGFIGSPPMNLLNGRVSADGRVFETEGGPVHLPEGGAPPVRFDAVLGLRPEALRPGGRQMTVSVEMVESLGADHLLHTRLGKQDLALRCGNDGLPEAGSALGLGFEADAPHWFDAKTGLRVAA
jgi:sn-glycerol 3-phosphate transport system ATP-binding protein